MRTACALKISFSTADSSHDDSKYTSLADSTAAATTITTAPTSTMIPKSTSAACDSEEERKPPSPAPAKKNAVVDTLRKGAVAVTGGTLTVVGLIMIPLPTPMGCVVAAAGMTLLGTEFESANRILAQAQESALAIRDKWREPKTTATCSSTCTMEQQPQQHDPMKQESELDISRDKDPPDKDKDDDKSFLSKTVFEPIRSARETWQPGTCGTSSPPPDDDNNIHAAAIPV